MKEKSKIEQLEDLREKISGDFVRRCREEGAPSFGFSADVLVDITISRMTVHAEHDDDHVERWIADRRKRSGLRTEEVPLRSLDKWTIDGETGNIGHETGRFFTIGGIKARHRTLTGELEWDQPIIDQPEIGILGIAAKKISGVLHFCLQAKEEPGTIDGVQLSPTVQATYSNYTQAHGGSLPPLVGLFLDPPRERVLFAKLQTEDGGRFLFKSNRNMIVLVGDEIGDLPDGFLWLTLRQIGRLLRRDNLVNACTRSVLSCLL